MQDFSQGFALWLLFPLYHSFKIKEPLPQNPALASETRFPKHRFWGLAQAIPVEWEKRHQRFLMLCDVHTEGRAALNLISLLPGDPLASFPQSPKPFPCILLLSTPSCWGWDCTLALLWLLPAFQHTISPTGFAAVFSASTGH